MLYMVILLLAFVRGITRGVPKNCRLSTWNMESYWGKGTLQIGGIFPVVFKKDDTEVSFTKPPNHVHCETFELRRYRWVQSLIFTLKEINENPDLLPNVTLGFGIFDSCNAEIRALKGVMYLLSGKSDIFIPNYHYQTTSPLVAVIGDMSSQVSIQMARVLGLYRVPHLLHFMKNVQFRTKTGEYIFFDANGDPPAVYELVRWQINPDETSKYISIGRVDFTSEEVLTLNKSAFTASNGELLFPHSACTESCSPGYRKVIQDGQPSCCFDCVPCSAGEISNKTDSNDCLRCPEQYWPNEQRDTCIQRSTDFLSYEQPLGAVLTALSLSGASVSAIILYIFVKNKDTPIVKANNRELSYLLLLALMLCFLCSLLFIGQPVTITCMLRQVVFAISFALCVSCILAKTTMVVIAFRATNPSSKLRRWVGSTVANAIVTMCTLIQSVLCTAWLAASHPFPENNTKSQIHVIIIECNEGSYTTFWLVLCYMGLMASASFIMAFLSRNLPDSFNEARFITFSMLVFLSVWLTFIPAHLSTKGKLLVAVEIFAIFSSSAGLLVCIFIPKCIIILLKPADNSIDFLMKRGNTK